MVVSEPGHLSYEERSYEDLDFFSLKKRRLGHEAGHLMADFQ